MDEYTPYNGCNIHSAEQEYLVKSIEELEGVQIVHLNSEYTNEVEQMHIRIILPSNKYMCFILKSEEWDAYSPVERMKLLQDFKKYTLEYYRYDSEYPTFAEFDAQNDY